MSGHEFVSHFEDSGDIDHKDQSSNITEVTIAEMRTIVARYPQKRSALMPILHLVQSVDGRVSPAGVKIAAELCGVTEAQVNGVATFYTMYKRRPAGTHHVGVCTTALCATMGGDIILEACEKHLGIKPDQTTADGKISLERIECNAACDFAPVMMVNWEFMDNMTPEKAIELIDNLRNDKPIQASRGATITSWKDAERVLAGFPDGRVDEGPGAAGASLAGLKIAKEHGWNADSAQTNASGAAADAHSDAAETAGNGPQARSAVADASNPPESLHPTTPAEEAGK